MKKRFLCPRVWKAPGEKNGFSPPPISVKSPQVKTVFYYPHKCEKAQVKNGFLLPPQVWKAPGEKRLFYYPPQVWKAPVEKYVFLLFKTLKLVWKARGEKRFHPKTCAKSSRWEKEKGFFKSLAQCEKVQNPHKSSFVR
jgi:hypothetical protein